MRGLKPREGVRGLVRRHKGRRNVGEGGEVCRHVRKANWLTVNNAPRIQVCLPTVTSLN